MLPRAGAVTRTVEGGDRCRDTPVEGSTLRGAGFLGGPLIGPTALGECPAPGLAIGGAFRAVSPAVPLRQGLGSGLTDGLDSNAGGEFEFVEGIFAKDSKDGPVDLTWLAESSGRALGDGADGFSERDSSAFDAARGDICELASPGRFGSAGDLASSASVVF